MSTYTHYGTSFADYISSYDLNLWHTGFNGFEIYGLSGDDTISLSIMSRSGVDVAWGGDGDDFLSGIAFNSDYAVALFDGALGNDRVYFSLMSPELDSYGRPGFVRIDEGLTQLRLTNQSDGTVLTAVISDTVERITIGDSGTYLTEDIAAGEIRAVDWNEEYARTFNGNSDWYLRGTQTAPEPKSVELRSGEVQEINGAASNGKDHGVFLEVTGTEDIYTYFYLTDFSDDLDLALYKKDALGSYTLQHSSESFGVEEESFFKALTPGHYQLVTSFYENLDYSGAGSSFKLTIDSQSFQQKALLPNDTLFRNQWSLFNTGQANGTDNEDIFAPEAWKLLNQSPDIVVAVIDQGVRISHEDLRNNLWTNNSEIAGNGVDDDKNGYIDDIHGWSFALNQNWWFSEAHGTHVAGLIGAEGNNSRGIAGVTWDTQLMSIDVFGGNDLASDTDIINGIYYAANNGADVINLSLGGAFNGLSLGEFSAREPDLYQGYFNALSYAVEKGCVVVCAAGNEALDLKSSISIPASFSQAIPGVVSVAAVGNTGDLTAYSNYSELVTIAAPGGDNRAGYGSQLVSTYHLGDSSYDYMPGTSMAAPLVSGAAALVMQRNRELSPRQVEEILTQSSFKYKSLQGLVEDGNYLNLKDALVLASQIKGEKNIVDPITGIENNPTFVDGNVYRLRDNKTGVFLFSSNGYEIDLITGQGWTNEGIAYAAPTVPTASLHRFKLSNGLGYFYTANEQEKGLLESSAGYDYEGIAFNVYSVDDFPLTSIPVVRYLGSSGLHLYSTSVAEQNILDKTAGWTREGIAWYADPAT